MRAFTLMTAMPPTRGHKHLMEFVAMLSVGDTGTVVVCTQPHEPFARERFDAIADASQNLNNVRVVWLRRELPQDPDTPGFWKLWYNIMRGYGFKNGDVFVSSELYGAKLARVLGGIFMPYDPGRELFNIKATPIRDMEELGLRSHFAEIMPTFQNNLRSTVTIFGAESTGKTTLSKELAGLANGYWLYEWARPYLETVGSDITINAMNDIWHGQAAAQRHTKFWYDKPFVVQDTDLFSTVGYWKQPHWTKTLGEVPKELVSEALELRSDLYLILGADIPFEQDEIRYGDGVRESPDEFWIGIADEYELPYQVIGTGEFSQRVGMGLKAMRTQLEKKQSLIAYDRMGF